MATNSMDRASYELADFGTRGIALGIDGLIVSVICGFGFLTVHEPGFGVGILIGLIYHWYFLTRNKGQTPGKMLMHIRVIKVDGSPITDSDAIVRYIGYIINSVFVIGWLWALFDDDHQGWHDKMAQTYVVNVE